MSYFGILLAMILVNNYVLAQFLGICPFLGVSKKLDSAVGMGVAVIFVMVLATAATWPIMRILNAWNRYLDYIASTINYVRTLLDCDVILGGYVGAYLEPYMDEIRRRTLAISTFDTDAGFIKLCSYQHEAIAAGAALHYISQFKETI